MYVILI